MAKKVSAEKYREGVESILVEQPKYETGHDGSDGLCDCIGMCRGGLKRAGATNVTNMRGTNQAARKAIQDLRKIESSAGFLIGDVVLKTRDRDDKSMPLPDQYRKGGSGYDPNVGETNFTHIGTVTGINPLIITHMTTPTAKQDRSIKNWTWRGKLPWVDYSEPKPKPAPEPATEYATVTAESGGTVKMRKEPSTACRLYWDVPIGAEVTVQQWKASTDKKGNVWSLITWAGQDGYMMKKFLRAEDGGSWTVTISGLTFEQAEQLCMDWSDATMKRG